MLVSQDMFDPRSAVQAQQRYRERRKAKFSEMEESLHALASQVEQMGNVQHQNNTLQVLLTSLSCQCSIEHAMAVVLLCSGWHHK